MHSVKAMVRDSMFDNFADEGDSCRGDGSCHMIGNLFDEGNKTFQ